MSRRLLRSVAVLLCGTVFLSTSGCASPEQRVEDYRELVRPGMSKAEVRKQLGEPVSMTATAGGGTGTTPGEYWLYRVDAGSGTTIFDVVFGVLVIVVVVAIVAVAASGGGGGNIGGGWGGGGGDDSNIFEFDITFGGDGRVQHISPVRRPGGQ